MHILASTLRCLAHCIRNGICFSNAHANSATIITNHNRYSKRETPTAFDHFCDTGNINNTLIQLLWGKFTKFVFCHNHLLVKAERLAMLSAPSLY